MVGERGSLGEGEGFSDGWDGRGLGGGTVCRGLVRSGTGSMALHDIARSLG